MEEVKAKKISISFGQLPLGIIPRDSRPSKIRENLYLGRAAHANDLVSLQELGITHIVNITDDCPNSFPDNFEYKHIAERDAPAVQLWPYFEDLTAFIKDAQDAGGCVLVHCFAGVSRSATITIAFLMLKEGLVLEQAFDDVRRSRPFISPNPGFLSQLRDLELRLYKKVMTPQRLTACDLGAREAKTVEVSFEDALIAYIGSSESVVNAMGEAAIERRRRQVLTTGKDIGFSGMSTALRHAIDSAFRSYGGRTAADIGAREVLASLLGQLVEEGVAGRGEPLAALRSMRDDVECWEELLMDVPLAEGFYRELEADLVKLGD